MTTCASCLAEVSQGFAVCPACGSLAGNPPGNPPGKTVDDDLSLTDVMKLSSVAVDPERSATMNIGGYLGRRYRIVKTLGVGGMGEVFHAYDLELNRDVAVKLIRSELANDPDLIDRFRREIRLSSTITHRNVLRAYDLGDADGRLFLSMQYIEGEDLSMLLRRGRMPVEEAVRIFKQICEGLRAAHEQNVIHRDLKPQNILMDLAGNVYLTDFGLAKMFAQTSMNDVGKVIGSPQYMSPEQVRGGSIDHRTDIYSLGIVFYRMLTGALPFSGETALEIMVQRLRVPPKPANEVIPELPKHLVQIADRCLALEPDHRYASVSEILRDLDEARFTDSFVFAVARRRWLKPVAAVSIVVLLAGGSAWWFNARALVTATASAEVSPVKVLIADMENRTREPVFNGTLESILALALEGAPFINSYNRTQARQLAATIQPSAKTMNESVARLVAVREGVSVVVAGAIDREGEGYRILLRAVEPMSGRLIEQNERSATNRDEVLKQLGELAAELRDSLGEGNSPVREANETFTAASIEAAHDYAAAQELQFAGRFEDAAALYEKVIKQDPNMGRAYAGLAAVSANLGDRARAERNYRLAFSRIDRMTDREKYRTRGGYYLLTRNPTKAIEEFSALVRDYPADTAGLNNLALSYFYTRDMPRALRQAQRTLEIYPTNTLYRANAALYAMYASDFSGAIRHARAVLAQNASYLKAYVALALAQIGLDQTPQALETYSKLESVSDRGMSMASAGKADLALYEGRLDDALSVLVPALEADLKRGDRNAALEKRVMLAETHLARGSLAEARALADEVVQAGIETNDETLLYSGARVLIHLKAEGRARELARLLERRIDQEARLYSKLIAGEIELHGDRPREALDHFREAQTLADTWLGRYGLGRSYLALGAFAEAQSELEASVKRRGEASAVFLNDRPTVRIFAPMIYYMARCEEGLGVPSAVDTYKRFLMIRNANPNDPLVRDARERVARL